MSKVMNYREHTERVVALEIVIDKLKELQRHVTREDTDWGEEVAELVNRMEKTLDLRYAQRERYKREFHRLNGRDPKEGSYE